MRELLSRYFETARTSIERYGGTVEKFIGDAVMAVWGTPVAQEDDAERAVRAALDLVAAVPALDPALQARAGVLTGEAAVTLGAEGQGMVAGDLVNTASRIQSAAEPGTVLVGEATKRASEAAIAYEDGGEHELKGKSESAHALARAARGRRIAAARGGRARSRRRSSGAIASSGSSRSSSTAPATTSGATLVTVIGVAGIGKSRLAWELEKHVDGLAYDIWWHRGRCLAYGEGVAFWALAEMVRMRARIARGRARGERARRSSRRPSRSTSPTRRARVGRAAPAPPARPRRAAAGRPCRPLLRLASLLRADERHGAGRARLRGPALGGHGAARLHRASARVVAREADLRRSR